MRAEAAASARAEDGCGQASAPHAQGARSDPAVSQFGEQADEAAAMQIAKGLRAKRRRYRYDYLFFALILGFVRWRFPHRRCGEGGGKRTKVSLLLSFQRK